MKKTQFLAHLNELAKLVEPDMDDIPTAEQILSGILFPSEPLDFDQQYQLLTDLKELIVSRLRKEYKSFPIMGEQQIANWFKFCENYVEIELAILYNSQLVKQGLKRYLSDKDKNTLKGWRT